MNNQNFKSNILKSDFQKKNLKGKKLYDFRLWTQQQNLKGHDICISVEHNKKYIKDQNEILNDEDLNPNKKQIKFEKKRRQIEGIIPSNIILSKIARNVLTDAYEKINYMKEYSNYWELENGKRLQKTTKEFCKGRPYSTNSDFMNLPSSELINKLYFHPLKHQKSINYIRYNDSFRRDINKAFQKYNPNINLKYLKKLRNEDNDVKKALDEIKTKVNLEIEEKIKGNFYRKKYENIMQKYKDNSQETDKHKMMKTRSTNFNSLNSTKNNFNVKKKKKIDLKEKELDLMEDALEPLFNVLEIEPIEKYIDDTFKNKKIDKNILSKKEKDYFPRLIETERALQKIQINKLNIENENSLENTLKKVNDDQISLIKGLEDSKDFLLSDISTK
jgi:hypothetical protein